LKPILVVGSYNVGLTIKTERVPSKGETVHGWGYCEGPGGKGSNQAIAVSRLGGKARFFGCVGSDRYGEEAVALWSRERVEAGRVRRVDVHTGLAFIVVEGSGGNVITIDAGANSKLTSDDVERAAELFEGCGYLLTVLEIPPETAAAAARLARKAGARVILNPAPAVPASKLELTNVDILTPNESEFEVLTGTTDLQKGSAQLLSFGPEVVIVTLGDRGAQVTTRDDSFRVPAPKVRAVDATGAGDAFNGALAVALAEGEPLASAVRFANYAGAMTVMKEEVVPAIPTRKELDEFRREDVLE